MARVIGISGKKQSGKTSLANYLKATLVKDRHDYMLTSDPIIYQDEEGEVFFRYSDGRVDININDVESKDVKIYSFGDTLKEHCMNLLGLDYEQCHGTDDQKNTLTKYDWGNLSMEIRKKYSKKTKAVSRAINTNVEEPSFINEKIPKTGLMTAREVMQVFGTDIARDMFDDNIWVNATLKKIEEDKPEIALIADVRFPSEIKPIMKIGKKSIIVRLGRTKDATDNHSSETSLDDFDWGSLGERSLVIDNEGITMEEKNKVVYNWLFAPKEILNG